MTRYWGKGRRVKQFIIAQSRLAAVIWPSAMFVLHWLSVLRVVQSDAVWVCSIHWESPELGLSIIFPCSREQDQTLQGYLELGRASLVSARLPPHRPTCSNISTSPQHPTFSSLLQIKSNTPSFTITGVETSSRNYRYFISLCLESQS